jgi:hypothetical protein
MYVNISPYVANHRAIETYAGAKTLILTLTQMELQVQLRELAALLHNKVCKSAVLGQIFIYLNVVSV